MSVYAEDFFRKAKGGYKVVDYLTKIKVTYHPLYPYNKTVRRLLPMIANSTIKRRDKIFKCEVEISEKYGPPTVEVDYDNFDVKRTFDAGSITLEDLLLKMDFYKRKILLHETVKEPEEAGDEWDPEVMEKNKKDAAALAAAQKAAPAKAPVGKK